MSFLLGIVLTHLNAAEQQTDKTSAFIELLTLTDDQLLNQSTDQQHLAASYPLNSYGSGKGGIINKCNMSCVVVNMRLNCLRNSWTSLWSPDD